MNTTSEKPTVWLVNESGHDYTDAETYGQLRAITVHNIDPFNVDRLMWQISHVIARLSHRDDYLLISGTPILTGLAMTMWLKTHDQCNILQWHAKDRVYVLSTITRDQLDNLVQKAIEGRWLA